MNKNVREKKCQSLQSKITRTKLMQLKDMDMAQVKRAYKFLEGYLGKIYARQKKVSRRKSNYLIDRVTVNMT